MAVSFSNPSPFHNPQTQQQQSSLFSSFAQPQQQQMQQFQFQPQQQQQLQPQQQQMYLYTVDKSPASYSTKWADLHPESQKFLLQIERQILEYKDESQRLDQCRLYDSSISNNSFEFLTNHIKQEFGRASNINLREKASMKELANDIKIIMWNTEKVIRSYIMLKPRVLPQNSSTTSNSISTSQTSNASQPNSSSMTSSYDFHSGLPKRPSPFILHTFERFEKYLAECRQMIQELEQLVLMDSDKRSSNSGLMLIESLPTVMSNVHDFFVHVAAKMENLHQYIESMKTSYLANQRRCGEENNPFIEADRREIAKQEAAAKRIHPTMNILTNTSISAPPQSTQGAGLVASSSMPLLSSNVQPQPTVSPPFSSGGSGLSLFNTTAASASTSSLFSTSITSNNNTTSNLFSTPPSTSFSTPQSTSLFGSAQNSSLFRPTPAPAPAPAPAPTFGSTPAAGNLLFSTPTLNTGGQSGSTASFAPASRPPKTKSRNARR